MEEVTEKTLKEAYKPFDLITDKDRNVGIITEVNVNRCQPEPYQISYSVEWLIGSSKTAWWEHKDLKKHCNIFVKIAECTCYPFGQNQGDVKKLMSTGI